MDEIRRQAYLQAMGIDNYFHRRTVSAVHPPELLKRESVINNNALRDGKPARIEAEAVAKPIKHSQAEETLSNTVSIKDLVHQQNETDAPVKMHKEEVASSTSQQPDESQSQDAESETQELRFCIQFYAINDRLAVINEIPYLHNTWEDKNIRDLLLAILKALDLELPLLEAPQVFHWPLGSDGNADAARMPEALLTLEGFMRKRLESRQYTNLLIFAGQCAELFQDEDNLNKIFSGTQAKIIATESLHAMLRVPVLKKQVWEDIRALQGSLSDPAETK
jgi:hypothetical protein